MTTTVIIQELDVSVARALRLLHSSDPDSEDQLHQMWKQSILEKYGSERTPTSVLHKINIPTGLKRESNHEIGDEFAVEVKKSKLGSPPTLFQRSAPASPQSGNSVLPFTSDEIEINDSNSDDDSDSESPLQILNGDGVCMKCKTSTSNSNNKLVECVDCHKHYHQQCHFPPITDMDLSDPRFVWYCAACEENITTTTTSSCDKNKSSSLSKASSSTSSAKNVSSPVKNSRPYGSTTHSSKTTASSSNKLSSDSSSKTSSSSSNSHDKKSSHAMKKRSLKKHDKRKSSK